MATTTQDDRAPIDHLALRAEFIARGVIRPDAGLAPKGRWHDVPTLRLDGHGARVAAQIIATGARWAMPEAAQ